MKGLPALNTWWTCSHKFVVIWCNVGDLIPLYSFLIHPHGTRSLILIFTTISFFFSKHTNPADLLGSWCGTWNGVPIHFTVGARVDPICAVRTDKEQIDRLRIIILYNYPKSIYLSFIRPHGTPSKFQSLLLLKYREERKQERKRGPNINRITLGVFIKQLDMMIIMLCSYYFVAYAHLTISRHTKFFIRIILVPWWWWVDKTGILVNIRWCIHSNNVRGLFISML